MKKLYIITYDLASEEKNYESLINKIKTTGEWARLGKSSYLVFSEMNHAEIRDLLVETLDINDKLYVGLMSNAAAWRGLGDNVASWILERQK